MTFHLGAAFGLLTAQVTNYLAAKIVPFDNDPDDDYGCVERQSRVHQLWAGGGTSHFLMRAHPGCSGNATPQGAAMGVRCIPFLRIGLHVSYQS